MAPDRPVTREWGDAAGRPLLFWPGLNPWGSLQLIEVGPLLAARGFRVVSVAPPGGGETPILAGADAYLPSRLADLVVDIADALGIDRFVFMGASWGASIGVHLGARHPDRVDALVLLDAGHTDVTLDVDRDELVRRFEDDQATYTFESWDAFLDQVRGRVRDWRPGLEPRYREGMVECDARVVPRASATAAAWALYGVAAEPPSAQLERLSMPVLLVLADNPDEQAVERFRGAVPHGIVETVASGHDIAEGAPEQLADLVAERLG